MKILIVNDDYDIWKSSVARIAYSQARFFKNKGDSIRLLTTTQDFNDQDEAVINGIDTIKIYTKYAARFRPYMGLYNPQTISKIKRLIAEFKPDIVHFHNIHTYFSYYSLKIAKQAGACVFLTAHDSMIFCYQKFICFKNGFKVNPWKCLKCQRFRYFPLRNAAIRHYINNYAALVIRVSEELRKALMANGIYNVETVHNGIESQWAYVAPDIVENFKRRYKLNGKKLILAGGRLSHYKGLGHLLKAFTMVNDKDATLLVAGGENAYQKHLRALAKNMSISDKVIFSGWLKGDDLKAAYQASYLCVNPSLCFESFSMFNLEAMLSGKPLISTNFGGAKETFDEGLSGIATNPYDIQTLASKMEFMLANESLSSAMGRKARNKVLNNFSMQRHIDEIRNIYKKYYFNENYFRRIQPLAFNKRKELFALYKKIFGKRKGILFKKRFIWQFYLNPFRQSGQITNWVLTRKNKIIGHIGIIPVKMKIEDKESFTGWGCDYMVDENNRFGKDIANLLGCFHNFSNFPISLGMAKNVEKIHTWAGLSSITIRPLLIKYIKSNTKLREHQKDPSITFYKAFDESFDIFWDKIKTDYPITVVRDQNYLKWLYANNKNRCAKTLVLKDKSAIVGFAVVEKIMWQAMNVGQITELLTKRNDKEAIGRLLKAIESVFAYEKAQAIITSGFPQDLRLIFKEHGFIEKNEISKTLVFMDKDNKYEKAMLENVDNWLITPGDSDLSYALKSIRWKRR